MKSLFQVGVWTVLWVLSVGLSGPVGAAISTNDIDKLAGSIEGTIAGEVVYFAALSSEYSVVIHGDIAQITLKQTFQNPYDKPMNARYLFPLNSNAAVHAMTMRIGNEMITAEIREIQQAKKIFSAAKKQGKAASLLQQHRPNMFTQKIANLMPGVPIEVDIQYVQVVPKIDGAYELVVPLVVGPRFQPNGTVTGHQNSDLQDSRVTSQVVKPPGSWEFSTLPVYPATAGVHLPKEIIAERVSLDIELEAPLPLQSTTSSTHQISVTDHSSTQQHITFTAGKVIDNKDFVLRYRIDGEVENAGILTHWEVGEGGYFSLLIEPPEKLADTQVLPREMVFLLDCSGSMGGLPMQASKLFMSQALAALRPTDTFRIIRFSDLATEFSTVSLPATAANIARGLAYTRSLFGSGGTVMTAGIEQALSPPIPKQAIRNIIFLTDGYIGNEMEVLQLVEQLLGKSRMFAFGVGAGVNRYLLNELSRVGGGFTRYFDPTRSEESVGQVAKALVAKLQTPVLADIEVDWGDIEVTDVLPSRIPDLYVGDSIRITGRFRNPSKGHLQINGRSTNQHAQMKIPLNLNNFEKRKTIRQLWARTAVADRMHTFVTPVAMRKDQVSNDNLKAGITQLGLSYQLATRWTAFVAVSKQIYNLQPENSAHADVALPKVSGVSKLAYNQAPSNSGGMAMTGYGAPEPGVWLGLLVAMCSLWVVRRRVVSRRLIQQST
ncbi:MAG: VWA domain-containing protein [Gammaproteobacteria bacterium]|nr:VWA domain-containing protein [Gammaproteobacteria bacterium]